VGKSEDYLTPALSLPRRVFGFSAAVLTAGALVGFAAGAWNPWRLVRLQQYFNDPFFGLVVVNVLALLAFWLLAPVRSEAAQRRRHTTRWLLILALLPVGMCYGLFHSFVTVETREIAQSPSGERRAAFVTRGDERELRIWSGGWLGLRDVGRAGAPCGPTATARFLSEDLVHISSNYGDFDVRLAHDTGRPLNPMGRTCSG
jgi:hypothetical protein